MREYLDKIIDILERIETVEAHSFHAEPGGKGFNQAVVAKRFGAELCPEDIEANREVIGASGKSVTRRGAVSSIPYAYEIL